MKKKIMIKKLINCGIIVLILAIIIMANFWAYQYFIRDDLYSPMDFKTFSEGISLEKENIDEDIILEYSYAKAISKDKWEYVYNLHNSIFSDDYIFVTSEKLKENKVTISITYEKVVVKHENIKKVTMSFIPLQIVAKEISISRYVITSYLDFGTFVNKNNSTISETDQLKHEVYEKYADLFKTGFTTDFKIPLDVFFLCIVVLAIFFLDVVLVILAFIAAFSLLIKSD